MPALFRIVQDDCPPIPEGASPIVKDFLYHCFQKDANLRISAKKLLRHPWMVAARRQLTDGREPEEQKFTTRGPGGWWCATATAEQLQLRRGGVEGAGVERGVEVAVAAVEAPWRACRQWAAAVANAGARIVTVVRLEPTTARVPSGMRPQSGPIPLVSLSLTKLQAPEKATEEVTTSSEENAKTIRPNKSPAPKPPVPLAKPPTEERIVEDYSDLVKELKMKNSLRFHPDELKTFGLGDGDGDGPASPMSAPSLMGFYNRRRRSPNRLNPLAAAMSPSVRKLSHSRSTSFTAGGFGKYQEEEDEDYEDVFGKVNGAGAGEQSGALQLTTRLSNRSWLGDNSDEEDPFAEIDEGFAEDDLEANLQRDKHAQLCNMVNGLIDQLTPAAPDFQLRDACDQLLALENLEHREHPMRRHQLYLHLRRIRDDINVLETPLLQLINLLVNSNLGLLESFCLIGSIPVMMEISLRMPSRSLQLYSSFVSSSVMTLQMFISCRGLKVLVDLLDEDYTEQTDLVVHALNGIGSVFELQSPTTKNDFCRMFIREGLLDPLSASINSATPLARVLLGKVYRALNWATGETVAVKEIQLSNIPKGELGEIMSEIDLLKNLNHPNIVKYKGFVKTREYLYIILDAWQIPENLVAVYISQVLEGLMYLHDQGVIHRDIKSEPAHQQGRHRQAGRLWCCEQHNERQRRARWCGSPYRMAPEVIEQSGATTASDIWSVGCVVIELSGGHPPYHALDPKPALFRIVQDDCPPIPEGASPIIQDFRCFQKDSNLRISAKKLRRHTNRRSRSSRAEGQAGGGGATATAEQLQLRRGGVEGAGVERGVEVAVAAVEAPWRACRQWAAAVANAGARIVTVVRLEPTTARVPSGMRPQSGPIPPLSFSLTKLQAPEKATEEVTTSSEENAKTIRPNKSPAPKPPVPLAKPPTEERIVEDYSDLVKELKMKNSLRFHPDELKTFGLGDGDGDGPASPMSAPSLMGFYNRSTSEPKPAKPVLSPLVAMSPSVRKLSHSRSTSFTAGGVVWEVPGRGGRGFEDVFGKVNGAGAGEQSGALQLTTRLSNRSWLGDNSDEEDPFAEIDEGFAEDDLEANLQRDKHAQLCNMVNGLIDQLTPAAPDFQLRDACDQLLALENLEHREHPMRRHQLYLHLRRIRDDINVLETPLLQLINLLVNSNLGLLESFCLIGSIPVMMGFSSKKYPSECRLEASNFIRLLCRASVMTLQMFISCRGLKVLVDLLDEDYTEQTDLVVHALNGIGSVLSCKARRPRMIFVECSSERAFSTRCRRRHQRYLCGWSGGDRDPDEDYTDPSGVLASIAVGYPRSECPRDEEGLLRSCELLEPDCLVQMLKAVKHLSMNATLLEGLQNANAIEILEMSNHIFQTCYYHGRLNKSRQEEVAQAGIIPCLQRVIETKSPLRQFALSRPRVDFVGCKTRPRVEDEPTKAPAVAALWMCFVSAKANSFENLLDPFLKITRLSFALTIAISRSPSFIKRITEQLAPAGGHSKETAVARLNLLRILRTVGEVYPNRAMLVERYGLPRIVKGLSRGGGDGAVFVRDRARDIVPVPKPGAATPGTSIRRSAGNEELRGQRSILAEKKICAHIGTHLYRFQRRLDDECWLRRGLRSAARMDCPCEAKKAKGYSEATLRD
ncbi:Protein kinase domain-containing protein [Mycena chlorophos]|uniref:non-specific serine/threonine protein kinase n=1 Tax=Mycena chlorophos TaxID=658473 RepID=A0A8H6TJW0_MYCCL|nr:Protein kinase domain-containing protein [Mycena chlorophos]